MEMRLVTTLILLAGCTQDDGVKVSNSDPKASIVSHADGDEVEADRFFTLLGSVSDPDTDADLLVVTWYAGSEEICPALNADPDGRTSCDAALPEGESRVTLEVRDPGYAAAADSVTLMATSEPVINTAPSCAITAPEDGSSAASGLTVSFEATVQDAESEPPELVVTWDSDLDGRLDSAIAGADGGVTFTTDGLSVGHHTITLSVTDPGGELCTDDVDLDVVDAPAVTILAPLAEDRYNEGAPIAFEGLVSSDLGAAEDLRLSWSSDQDGELDDTPADSAGSTRFNLDDLSPGEHEITLEATDELGQTGSDTVRLTINGKPSAPVVSITPDPASTGDDLTVSIDTASVDPEGEDINYSYEWTLGGSTTSYAGSSVPAEATSDDQTWTVTVTPNDGEVDGPTDSASVTIANTAPTVSGLSLSPSSAYTDSTLSVRATTSDADGDSVSLSYVWTVAGTTVSTASTLSGTDWFSKGQIVQVTVTPTDGTDSGSSASASTTVLNAAPGGPTISVSPSLAESGFDALLCEVDEEGTDADGDAITYTMSWEVDGLPYPSGFTGTSGPDSAEWPDDTVPAADTDLGETWVCTAIPDDGETEGTAATASATALDFYHLGNDAALSTRSSSAPGYLLGTTITVPSATTLYQLGVVMETGGVGMRMALYTDSSGTPETLVAYTAHESVATGDNTLDAVSPATLSAGTYWLMAVYDALSHPYYTSSTTKTVYYKAASASATPSSSYGTGSTYCCQDFSYYLVVAD